MTLGEQSKERILIVFLFFLITICMPVIVANRVADSQPLMRVSTLFLLSMLAIFLSIYVSLGTAGILNFRRYPQELESSRRSVGKLILAITFLTAILLLFQGNGVSIALVAIATGVVREVFDGGMYAKIRSHAH
jgi:Na+/proline symporter